MTDIHAGEIARIFEQKKRATDNIDVELARIQEGMKKYDVHWQGSPTMANWRQDLINRVFSRRNIVDNMNKVARSNDRRSMSNVGTSDEPGPAYFNLDRPQQMKLCKPLCREIKTLGYDCECTNEPMFHSIQIYMTPEKLEQLVQGF